MVVISIFRPQCLIKHEQIEDILPIYIPCCMRSFLFIVILILMYTPTVQGQSDSHDASKYLAEIEVLANKIVTHAKEATAASTVEGVKEHANNVFELVWGQSSILQSPGEKGAVPIHGWKTRWQVNNDQFDEAFADRNGVIPPAIEDVQQLGIMGRGRAVRLHAQKIIDSESASEADKQRAEALIASLNNVIGWMKMDDGVTKGERQPRVDLTREWDSSIEFWQSTADTGWLAEVFSQAVNILKVDYDGDVAEANKHAEGLLELSMKMVKGVDADGNGTVESVKMEGGVEAIMSEAQAAGMLD